MNIQQAKEEISAALKVYHRKDENGLYVYPPMRQRPILLIGPPGIGKTAIMEQIAGEEGIGLVSYTMTHHTRQSAIGLPRIVTRQYGQTEYTITEYTLSEIIASVYECMQRTGCREGILFIDEINCVSETLSPVMLQFLQNKMFGAHRVPQGWMIVAAGNPPEYNRSAKEFDIVTLDRVREIRVEADLGCWMEYAGKSGVHGAILSYLHIHPDDFYRSGTNEDGQPSFVTARGWEDLSKLLIGYAQLGYEIEPEMVREFLQSRRIAEAFASYYRLYCVYGQDYGLEQILDGTACEEQLSRSREIMEAAGLQERFTVIWQIASLLRNRMAETMRQKTENEAFIALKNQFLESMQANEREGRALEWLAQQDQALQIRADRELVTFEEEKLTRTAQRELRKVFDDMLAGHASPDCREAAQAQLDIVCEDKSGKLKRMAKQVNEQMTRGLDWAADIFSAGAEVQLIVSALTDHEQRRAFLQSYPNRRLKELSAALTTGKEEKELRQLCRELLISDAGND